MIALCIAIFISFSNRSWFSSDVFGNDVSLLLITPVILLAVFWLMIYLIEKW